MNGENISWFFESANEHKNSGYVPSTSSFSPMVPEGDTVKTFDQTFNDLYERYNDNGNGIDIKKDIRSMMSDRQFMEAYKEDLLYPVFEAYRNASPNDPHVENVIENIERFWDTKVSNFTESASVIGFMPISTLEFPVLVKQFFSSPMKDIIELETVKSPSIIKHVRINYMVDNNTGLEYEYPKCMFNGDWEKIFDASKGLKIREDVVPFVDGRLSKYDIIDGLTDGIQGVDKLSMQLAIVGVQVAGEKVMLPGNGITIEFSAGSVLANGDLNFDAPSGTHIEDVLGGQVDFKNGTISVASTTGQVEGIVLRGYLSNEKNLRSVSVREERKILRYKIEDGPRWNMPFSIEEIEDAAALLDINYYNRMVDEIVRTQEMQECMTVIKFLCDQYLAFKGIKTDPNNLESLSMEFYADLNAPQFFSGDPFKYVSSVIQFRLKAIIFQMTELVKLENLSFIIVGNSMATQLIDEFTKWKYQNGTSIGGITVNGSYGFATGLGANVRVVASNLYDPYTVEADPVTGKRELVLHIYCYPTDKEHISFKHLKYTSHLFTSQAQTDYQSTQAPGGAYKIVTATSRFKDIVVQGIAADLVLRNSEFVYGEAPARNPITGAPFVA